MIFLGFDPGGKDSFGWACLHIGENGKGSLSTGLVSTVPEAVDAVFKEAQGNAPIAVGIDAPLFWVLEGDRKADQFIRNIVCKAGGKSGTVSHVNSLRGACLVQGILTAKSISETWPSAKVTESHPKALLRIHSKAKTFLDEYIRDTCTEHERDAALGAYVAWSFAKQSSGWQDLVLEEDAPIFPSGNPVVYWFPS